MKSKSRNNNWTNLLTIAMPVYERKEFFLEALESAMNQTVKCEIIVVDNCSSHDYFKKICKQKGITYYRNEENIGLYGNCNRCFELAKTDYVMTLDDDDKIAPVYVESFLKAKEQYPNLDIYFTDFVLNTPEGKKPHHHTLPFGYMKNGQKVIEYAIRYKLGFPINTCSIKRTKFTGYYTEFKGSNDWVWIYSNADDFVFYGDSRTLFEFRSHDNQDTNNINNVLSYRVTIPYIYDAVLKVKVTNPEFRQLVSKHAFWSLIQLKSVASKSTLKEFVNSDNIFSKYLRDRLKEDLFMKVIFALPSFFVDIFFRSSRKIGISN